MQRGALPMKYITLAALGVAVLFAASAAPAQAGDIYLTGHDVLLHGGQRGYDSVIMEWLRGSDAAASYDIAVVGSQSGSASFTGGPSRPAGAIPATGTAMALSGSVASYGSVTYYNTSTADWTSVLSKDLLIILSHTSCGGCDLNTAGSGVINANSAAIAAAFNSGMDIWGISSGSLSTYYDFLPPGAAAAGASIGGSTGFTATAAGTGIGIVDPTPGVATGTSMINGFPTHNRFTTFDSDFTVFETRPVAGGPAEIISIGIRNATIGGGGISTSATVPVPAPFLLGGLGLLGLGIGRRIRRRRLSAN